MSSNNSSTCSHVLYINDISWKDTADTRTNSTKCKLCNEDNNSSKVLWLCMTDHCRFVACAHLDHDHSMQHYQSYPDHHICLNMTSTRLWCYTCECEVFISNNDPPLNIPEIHGSPGINEDNTNYAPETMDYNEMVYNQTMIDEGEDEDDVRGITGLNNLGNTCYMNSAIQALSNCEPLTQYFLNCCLNTDHNPALSKYYNNLLKDIWSVDRLRSVSPDTVVKLIKQVHPMFAGYTQQDSQEFLRTIMDRLHEEIKYKPHPSVCVDPLRPADPTRRYSCTSKPSPVTSTSSFASQSDGDYETCESSSADSALSLSSTSSKESSTDFTSHEITSKQQSSEVEPILSASESATSQHVLSERFKDLEIEKKSKSLPEYHSAISDIFDGRLLSSVQCLTCDKVSSTKETFMDLSIPIPSREQLNIVRYSTTNLVCGQNSKDLQRIQNLKQGWMSWMYGWMTSWVWGPNITLQDCLEAFFSADELKGDNMYSCEHCKKLRNGLKYSRVLQLPEILCINLKRFRLDFTFTSKISSHVSFPLDNLDMTPYLHKDCADKIKTYDLISIIIHHGVSGGGHYTSKCLNYINDKWYHFDDSRVTEVSRLEVERSQSYVLFYRKQNDEMVPARTMAAQIMSEPRPASLIRYFISRQWINKFNTFAEPGPISNQQFLCPHKAVSPFYWKNIGELGIYIPENLWIYLHQQFGGGPVLNDLYECGECKNEIKKLDTRRFYELHSYKKLSEDSTNDEHYAISHVWYKQWEDFVFNRKNNVIPGAIDNRPIAKFPRRAVSAIDGSATAYCSLRRNLWRFLFSIYGGGPVVVMHNSRANDSNDDDEMDDEVAGEIGDNKTCGAGDNEDNA